MLSQCSNCTHKGVLLTTPNNSSFLHEGKPYPNFLCHAFPFPFYQPFMEKSRHSLDFKYKDKSLTSKAIFGYALRFEWKYKIVKEVFVQALTLQELPKLCSLKQSYFST